MKNGTWKAKHNVLGNFVKVVSYNGNMKVYTDKNFFLKTLSEDEFKKNYIIVEQLKNDDKFNIAWYVDGIRREFKILRVSYAVAQNEVNKMRRTTHKTGKLLIVQA